MAVGLFLLGVFGAKHSLEERKELIWFLSFFKIRNKITPWHDGEWNLLTRRKDDLWKEFRALLELVHCGCQSRA
jgi:hypothetical protein